MGFVTDDRTLFQDVDQVMSCGLGMRYAFMGPYETAHLNAAGMEEVSIVQVNSSSHINPTSEPVL